MDEFGFEQLAAWLAHRVILPPGPLLCVIDGSTRGRRWSATAARAELRALAVDAGVRRRFAPHHYADLMVMPTMPGELLHEVDLAVGKVGVIRGIHGAPWMNVAKENRSSQLRPYLQGATR